MTQKERLVDLLLNAPFAKEISQMDASCAIEYNLYLSDLEAFADYLLKNGVIVPPCKIGDTVYTIWYRPISKKYFVETEIVESITFDKSDWFVETDDNLHFFGHLFKEDWFIDREEAEQALKECENIEKTS